jgi:alpha-tubulin suppressor-like RCC1 family protein
MRALSCTLLASLAALLVSVSACSDDARDPFAPEAPAEIQKDFGTIDLSPDPAELVGITAGGFHTCVNRRDGRTYCWGLDNEGQVGRSPTATCATGLPCVERPLLIASYFKQVDAGYNHTCGVTHSYAGFCWGGSRPSGQVGTGLYNEYFSPQLISGSNTFTSISAGTYSTCATTTTGMMCWGELNKASKPLLVSTFNGYSRVSVGRVNACAYYDSYGYRTAECWGNNSYGQLGFDPAIAIQLPFTVGSGTGTDVSNVSTGGDYTCVDQGNTTVQCFGSNLWGRLGNGNFQSTYIPQTVGGAMQLRGVTTAENHACALSPSGAAFCWGNGYHGQLGNSVQAVSSTPVPVAMPYNTMFIAIAAGQRHTCAIGVPIRIRVVVGTSIPQTVYCWGDNSFGQLGRGIWTPDGTPMRPLPTTALE